MLPKTFIADERRTSVGKVKRIQLVEENTDDFRSAAVMWPNKHLKCSNRKEAAGVRFGQRSFLHPREKLEQKKTWRGGPQPGSLQSLLLEVGHCPLGRGRHVGLLPPNTEFHLDGTPKQAE